MRLLSPSRRITILFVLLFIFTGMVRGQLYNFRSYGYEAGLPNDFVYTVNQADNGFLWIGTGKGLVKFDGYEFYSVDYPDTLTNRNPTTSLKAANGSLWFGCSDGTVFYTLGNDLLQLDIKNDRSISQILQGADNMIYVIPQGKTIYKIDPADPQKITMFNIPEEYVLLSAAFDKSGNLICGSQGYIVSCIVQKDTILVNSRLEAFDYSAVTALSQVSEGSTMLAGTEDYGLYLLKEQDGVYEAMPLNGDAWNALSVRSIYTDNSGNVWVASSGSGVIRFNLSKDLTVINEKIYDSGAGLPSDNARTVFRDIEGNYWFGLFGKGISMLASRAFEFHAPGHNSAENNVIFIGDSDGNLIYGTQDGIHFSNPEPVKTSGYKDLSSFTGGVNILSYYLDDQGNIWIGTDGKGLYVMSKDGSPKIFHRSGDSGLNRINNIRINNGEIWCAATNGVVVLDRQTGRELATFNSNNGLPGKSINSILFDNDIAYIATESDRLYQIKDFDINSGTCLMTGSTLNKISGLAIGKDGMIWASTYGNGVFGCYGDSLINLSTANGLFSNYCYGILSDSDGDLWVSHGSGISRYNGNGHIITTYGPDYLQGGTCNFGSLYEKDGKIYVGTTKGVVIYDKDNEISEKVPPVVNINSVIINDVEYKYAPEISLKYGKYKIRINYSGINFSDPDKVSYQTFLENHEAEPAEVTSSREVLYILSDGRYKFNLTAIGEDGITSGEEEAFIIHIAKPVYKKLWFILLAIAAVISAVIVIIKQREKSQKRIQKYLEDELEKRTELIVRQKDEIEIQNLEITDSINYAKRIQSSILPDVNKLKENFPEAFLIFKPRDIVSGDYYWFDKIDDDKFIIVCADSTGHGVPGAFMSMIGSTLLQDIVTRKKISRPSQILTNLDKQIFSTLNQNTELGASNDGMDMVVCEFNLRTRYVRFASAMRPIIIVIGGEILYVKGNRSSIGGESAIGKYFDDQEYYLNEGDSIYLFSDGFPDQFGGDDGKKMKIARLKKIIEQHSALPMWEQEKMIMSFFEEWRGTYDQVDDILMIGLRV